jgi:TonB-linked SusC/RagA family outer membrane protein
MLILLIATFSSLSLQASDTSQAVTIWRKDAKVIDVLADIENQTDFKFFYSNTEVDTKRKVTLQLKNVPLSKILDTLFSTTSTTYKFSEKFIVLVNRKKAQLNIDGEAGRPPTQSEYFTIKISGKVTSDSGEPLAGVNIIEKGSNTGAVSDADGRYSINVPKSGRALVFSYIGFQNIETQLNGRTVVNVVMSFDNKILSEIVVVGYGTEQRRGLTGAISSVSENAITQLPVTNAQQSMQGRLAGVTVTQSASPGGNISVRIRGVGTIGFNEPLFIVDGVQSMGNLNHINPGDIESIDVLKDASAAAIYGSRAANGVIIITTKRGLRNTKTKVDFSSYTGVQQRWKEVDVLDAKKYVQVITEARQNADAQRAELGSVLLDPLPANFNADSVHSITNWQKETFRSGIIQNYQLSVSGGSDKTNFSISGSFRDEKGIIINSDFKRYTFRTNIDHDVSSRLTLGCTFNLAYTDRREIPDNDIWNGVLQSAVSMPEMFGVKDSNGNYIGPPGGNSPIYGNSQNPVGQAERTDAKNPSLTAIGNIYADVNIIDGLTFKSLFSVDLNQSSFKYYQPTFAEGSRPTTVATLYQSSTHTVWWNWENTLTYEKQLGNHQVAALLGSSAQEFDTEFFSAGGRGFPKGDPIALRYLPYASTVYNAGTASSFSLLSFFGRAKYNFKDKYLMTVTVRKDGSSRFHRNKWGTFPSISAGWRISEEFLKSSAVISDLKLRASWGQVGNQSVNSDFPWVTSVGPSISYNTVLGGVVQPGVALIQNGNENLTWETTTITNVGLDLGLFSERIVFNLDYFVKDTRNILLQIPLSLIAGQSSPPYVNAGAVRNRGFEIGALYRKTFGKFTYRIGANASLIRNKVTDLAGVEYIIVNNTLRGSDDISRVAVGNPIGSYFGYSTDGIFKNQAEIDNHATQEPGTRPGDIRYKDLSGPNGVPDGVITAEDRIFLGDGLPDVAYGMSFNGKYKNFDVALFVQGVSGVKIFNGLEYLTLNNQGGNKTTEILDYWSESNPDGAIPRLTWDDPNRNSRISDRYIHDGSYVRIKNCQVGYNFDFPESRSSIAIQQARVYLSIQNLLTFTKYSGFDPEVGAATIGYRSDMNLGVDQGRYPQSRIFLVGFNVTL